jgi:hypothetical protein
LFDGLHLLVGSYADRLRLRPALQAAALRAAFGPTSQPAVAERFLVGLAAPSPLAEIAGTCRCNACPTTRAGYLSRPV